MITFKIEKEKIEELKKKYSFKEKINQNYSFWFKKFNDFTVSIYKSNKILFQGNKEQINIFLNKEEINNKEKYQSFEHIGCDESGVGDYFGPIILTVFKYDDNIKNLKIFEKVKDSKKINIKKIFEIGKELIKLTNNFKTYKISNEELNESVLNKNINSKEILLIKYIDLLKNKIFQHNIEIIIDGFINKNTFNKYCLKHKIFKIPKIKLIQKAEEKYIAVASASIISRYFFLKEIENIEKKLNIKILLGSNEKVKKQIKELLKNKEKNKIKKYIKLFFNI